MAACFSSLQGCVPIKPVQQASADQGSGLDTETAERRKVEDDLFANAKSAGKVILVVPTASLDSLNVDFQNNDSTMEFLKLRSAVTEWTNTRDPSSSFKVGYDTKTTDIGTEHGSYFQVVFGHTLYKIYLINPGRYSISSLGYDLPRTPAFATPGDRGGRPSPMGYATFEPKSFTEYDRGQKWEDATYRTETVEQKVCTQVRVVSGECTYVDTQTYDVKRQTGAAGWRQTISQREVEGRTVTAHLSKEFAAFDVAAGEVVLIDGFFADPPSINYDPESCKQTQQRQMRCELEQVRMVKILGEVDQVLHAQDPADYGFPKMAGVLKQLTYRPITVQARKVSGQSAWGPTYSLEVN
ncbi:hypothetical protein NA655_12020 [Pseudomonas kuykendallii]|uniref:Uncharacterized protein n=1 Tax=Pseudomonas kuykendallii TaxID=1007099 RepID=A0A1H2QLD5_9PSED|nr:hypothetical protein [Pseudomonas kuykendallii]MCQ4271745.1 hypothetical protein [Pseudomonas kuykendallii]SDW07951.1 hypothetical protein SAMN05216287_0087 [Pseudomonas kuykendallii]